MDSEQLYLLFGQCLALIRFQHKCSFLFFLAGISLRKIFALIVHWNVALCVLDLSIMDC